MGFSPARQWGGLKRADNAESQVFDPTSMRDRAEGAIDSATGF